MLNFEPEDIKVNESALVESLFSWQHPLVELNCISMCLFNIRSWNGRLEHLLSDNIYSTYSSLFCFTEASINGSSAKHVDEVLDWKDID